MSPVDALLFAALLVWCVGLVRAIVHCLYSQTLVPGVARTRGRRWLLWPLVLLAHYLGPRLTLRSRLTAVGQLKRAGISGAVSAVDGSSVLVGTAPSRWLASCRTPVSACASSRRAAASSAGICRESCCGHGVVAKADNAARAARLSRPDGSGHECGCAPPEPYGSPSNGALGAHASPHERALRELRAGFVRRPESQRPPCVLPVASFASELARLTTMAPQVRTPRRVPPACCCKHTGIQLNKFNNYRKITVDLLALNVLAACSNQSRRHRRYPQRPL
jgi:hypothetical protein